MTTNRFVRLLVFQSDQCICVLDSRFQEKILNFGLMFLSFYFFLFLDSAASPGASVQERRARVNAAMAAQMTHVPLLFADDAVKACSPPLCSVLFSPVCWQVGGSVPLEARVVALSAHAVYLFSRWSAAPRQTASSASSPVEEATTATAPATAIGVCNMGSVVLYLPYCCACVCVQRLRFCVCVCVCVCLHT